MYTLYIVYTQAGITKKIKLGLVITQDSLEK